MHQPDDGDESWVGDKAKRKAFALPGVAHCGLVNVWGKLIKIRIILGSFHVCSQLKIISFFFCQSGVFPGGIFWSLSF